MMRVLTKRLTLAAAVSARIHPWAATAFTVHPTLLRQATPSPSLRKVTDVPMFGQSVPEVDYAGMKEIIETYEQGDSEYVVFDVRRTEEIERTGQLSPNTFHLPWETILEKNLFTLKKAQFQEISGVEKPSKKKTLVFSCAAGIRSIYACNYALYGGYTHVLNYPGGANEWFKHNK
jgi:rhodanese-related sulfurtransferase